jgi:lipoprotein NlpD
MARRTGWRLSVPLALALAGCATVNEAPVVDLSTDPGPRVGRAPSPAARPTAPVVGNTHRVAAGETLYGIAFRHGLDYRALAEWNAIPPPFTIRPGQTLRLAPPPRAVAAVQRPVTPAPAAARPPLPTERQPGDAATPGVVELAPQQAPAPRMDDTPPPAGAAQTFGLGAAAPAPALAIEPVGDAGPAPDSTPSVTPSSAAPAEPLPPRPSPPTRPAGPLAQVIGGGTRPPPSATAAVPSGPPAPEPPTVVPPATAVTAAPAPTPVPAPAQTVANAKAASALASGPSRKAGGVAWRWPAQGTVVTRFIAGDPARQGVDVRGRDGAPVVAAADGEVVYSGNGLVGYGELVIIKHSPEFLSAYGHNRRRLVTEGQRVKAGQQIAEMGRASSGFDALHFEIRRSGRPVDPLQFLPPR